VLEMYEKPKKEGLDKKVIYESTLLQWKYNLLS
jgi:hypothetical protein